MESAMSGGAGNLKSSINSINTTLEKLDSYIYAGATEVTATMTDADEYIANPNMGIVASSFAFETIFSGWNSLLSSPIGTVTPGTPGTLTGLISGIFFPKKVGLQLPHFDANLNYLGVIELVSVTPTLQYIKISGSEPVVNGYLLNQEYDFTLSQHGFTWNALEPTKGVFDWTAFEIATKIKVIKELNRIGWGKPKKIIPLFVCDVPTGAAHQNIPAWLVTEMTAAGLAGAAYNTGGQQGYCPNYSNTAFISNHERVINVIAAKYKADSAFVKVGTLGYWGECWYPLATHVAVPFPVNAIVDVLLGHYATAFGAKNCRIRRNIGNAGAMGMGFYNDGFLNDDSVEIGPDGSIGSLSNGCTDLYGYAQVAVSGWQYRANSGEPYGTVDGAENEVAYADASTSLVLDNTVWEAGRYVTATGVPQEDGVYYRTADAIAAAANTEYIISCHPSFVAKMYQYTSADAFISTTNLENKGKVTTAATCAKVKFAVSMDDFSTPMTAALFALIILRVYLTSAGDSVYRNFPKTDRFMTRYHMTSYTDNPSSQRISGARATEANQIAFLKKLGYRLRAKSLKHYNILPIGKALEVTLTIENKGYAPMWIEGSKLEIAILDSTHAVVSFNIIAVRTIGVGDTAVTTRIACPLAIGAYDISVAILDADNIPVVDWCGGTNYSKRYVLSNITVI